jgi:hypothetical protein
MTFLNPTLIFVASHAVFLLAAVALYAERTISQRRFAWS